MPSQILTRHSLYVQRDAAARSLNHCWRGRAINITESECVSVGLFIQYAKRMRRITLINVACPVLHYFPTLSHKPQDFRKIIIEHKMWVLIFSTNLSEPFLIL
jgi:hypothetical protein